MATSLKQIQSQKQKLAPKQVLNAKLLQLSLANLEQTIIEEPTTEVDRAPATKKKLKKFN